MAANQTGQFADILTAASSKSNTTVAMLGESFKNVAPVAGALGYSAEDTATALGLMAKSGVHASQTGTALSSALSNMASPTKEMAKIMDELGLSLTDNQGNMKSLDTVMQDLRNAFGGLDEDQQKAYASTLFGKEAMSGMLAIINTSEAEYQKLSDAINHSSGATQQMADMLNDNAKGGLVQLQSALEGLMIQLSEILIPIFNDIVGVIQQVVNWFASLDESTQKVIVVMGGIVAAIGPVLNVLGPLVTSVGLIIDAFRTVSDVISAAGGVMSILTSPVGIAIGAITALAVAAYLIYENWEPIKEFFFNLWENIKNATAAAWEGIKQFFSETWEWMQSFFAEWGTVILAVIEPFMGIPLLIMQNWDEIMIYLSGLWESVKETASEAWNAIVEAITAVVIMLGEEVMRVFASMSDGLTQIWEGVKMYFGAVWDIIKTIFLGTILLIYDLVTGNFTQLSADAQLIWNSLKDAFGRIWEAIKLVFSGTLDAIKGYIAFVWTTIKSTTESVWNGVKTFFATLWDSMKKMAQTYLDEKKKAIETTWNAIMTFFTDTWDKIKWLFTDGLENAKQSVINGMITIKDSFFNYMDDIVQDVKNFASDFMAAGEDFVMSIWDGIQGRAGWLYSEIKGFVNRMISSIRNAIPGGGGGAAASGGSSGGGARAAAYPGLKDGGTVTRSGWTWTGENGPELLYLPKGSQVIPNYDLPGIGAATIDYNALAKAIAANIKPSVTLQNTYNSPAPLSPSEMNRKTLQVSRQLALEWGL
ncbi:phage tail tape measure protein [Brevibacillus borstelensis]|uniref:phage tail tape measure protein n=1 Tax=Brevibacillus borstelensis TaxID=45462 RepID=UPI0030C27B68